MTWIEINRPGPEHPQVEGALREAMVGYPAEYAPGDRGARQVPASVVNDSIVLAHSLIPNAMKHMIAGLAAMMDPSLPLSRREHEMIAATVSRLNQCFY